MKKNLLEFARRGLMACGFGPLVLVGVYLILRWRGGVDVLTVSEVCVGILSLSALAFVAGGMNAVYQIERLPLAWAVALHGGVLYLGYLATYLLNGWLQGGRGPLAVFTAVFVLGYLAIWAVIYAVTKRNTARLNEKLRRRQGEVQGPS